MYIYIYAHVFVEFTVIVSKYGQRIHTLTNTPKDMSIHSHKTILKLYPNLIP